LRGNILGDQRGCQLKIGVGDVTGQVFGRDEAFCNVRRELCTPKYGGKLLSARREWGGACSGKQLAFAVVDGSACPNVGANRKPDTAHAQARGVARSDEFGGGLGYQFMEAGWSVGNFRMEPAEVGETIMDASGEADPFVSLVAQRFLEKAEEAASAGKREDHGAQFAEEFVPLFDRGTFLRRGDAIQDFLKPGNAMGRHL
jgi:hypothetical protein